MSHSLVPSSDSTALGTLAAMEVTYCAGVAASVGRPVIRSTLMPGGGGVEGGVRRGP